MKSTLLIALSALALTTLPVFAGDCCDAKAKDKNAACTATQYVCTMHPEVVSDKPGKCPKCGDCELKAVPAKPEKAK